MTNPGNQGAMSTARVVDGHSNGHTEFGLELPSAPKDTGCVEIIEVTAGGDGEVGRGLEEKYPAGNSTAVGAVANFVNTIVGAGIIGLPFAIAEVRDAPAYKPQLGFMPVTTTLVPETDRKTKTRATSFGHSPGESKAAVSPVSDADLPDSPSLILIAPRIRMPVYQSFSQTFVSSGCGGKTNLIRKKFENSTYAISVPSWHNPPHHWNCEIRSMVQRKAGTIDA